MKRFAKIWTVSGGLLGLFAANASGQAIVPFSNPMVMIGCQSKAPIFFTATGGATFSPATAAPGCTSFKVEVLAGGGQAAQSGRGGGSGGCYSAVATIAVTSTAWLHIGTGGTGGGAAPGGTGDDTWFNKTSNAAPSSTTDGALAKGGPGGLSGTNSTACSTASGVGTTKFAGGIGLATNTTAGGGGGGAAGPNGAGANGTAASGSTPGVGGQGDNGFGGTAGNPGTEWDGTHGSGGGGSGSNASCPSTTAAGLYGAASGGCSSGTAVDGRPGIVVITPLG